MTQEQAQKIAEDLFKHYPKQEAFYITDDGQAFFTKNDAINHVKQIKGEVTTIDRNPAATGSVEEDQTGSSNAADTEAAAKQKAIQELEKKKASLTAKLGKLKDEEKIAATQEELAKVDKELELALAQ